MKLVPTKKKIENKLYLWTVVHGTKLVEEVPVQRVEGQYVVILNKNFQEKKHLARGIFRSYFNTRAEANTFVRNGCK